MYCRLQDVVRELNLLAQFAHSPCFYLYIFNYIVTDICKLSPLEVSRYLLYDAYVLLLSALKRPCPFKPNWLKALSIKPFRDEAGIATIHKRRGCVRRRRGILARLFEGVEDTDLDMDILPVDKRFLKMWLYSRTPLPIT